jgi:tetratricopeptide (TPR) repeat protein
MSDEDLQQHRIQSLEEMRGLATEGSYNDALELIGAFLSRNPSDLEGWRLKGNVLELKALDANEYNSKRLTSSHEYMLARECYEKILAVDPSNTIALIDLGDHYKNLDAFDKAMTYYQQAADALSKGEHRLSWDEEVHDLLDRTVELTERPGVAEKAGWLREACQKMLDRRQQGEGPDTSV